MTHGSSLLRVGGVMVALASLVFGACGASEQDFRLTPQQEAVLRKVADHLMETRAGRSVVSPEANLTPDERVVLTHMSDATGRPGESFVVMSDLGPPVRVSWLRRAIWESAGLGGAEARARQFRARWPDVPREAPGAPQPHEEEEEEFCTLLRAGRLREARVLWDRLRALHEPLLPPDVR